MRTNALLNSTLTADEFIDVECALCGQAVTACPLFTERGELISYDGTHLTVPGARYYGEQLAQRRTCLAPTTVEAVLATGGSESNQSDRGDAAGRVMGGVASEDQRGRAPTRPPEREAFHSSSPTLTGAGMERCLQLLRERPAGKGRGRGRQ
jgi:hypothetical protein